MKGNITCTRPMMTAVGVYSSGPSPNAEAARPMAPLGPSSMLQPKARTTSEINSGDSTTNRKIERQGLPMRDRM
ncbi:hypothetical protein G6F22_021880 [Rhizopus arrhizus]|nr:hypothetical protein G6F22_021880 [Rhizopus arrhizus]